MNKMKSSKQRRRELKERKQARQTKLIKLVQANKDAEKEFSCQFNSKLSSQRKIPVDCTALAPNNSYGQPHFVSCGYYVDEAFICAGCGSQEVWTAAQQKWWYEVAKGNVFSTAKFCRTCRNRESDRRNEARRIPERRHC